MGYTMQINPTSPARSVSVQLMQALEPHLEDFELRYCALEPSAEAIRALRAYAAAWPEEQEAVTEIIALLERREPVELLIGF